MLNSLPFARRDDDNKNGYEYGGAITLGAWTHVVGTMQGAHGPVSGRPCVPDDAHEPDV